MQRWHYEKGALVQFWATWALSKVDLGENCKHYRQLSEVGTILRWIWVKFGPSWHYPKVGVGQNLAKLELSKGGFGSRLGKGCITRGGSGPKNCKVGTLVHVGTIQG